MKRYIVLSLIISIAAHGVFFSIFKGTLPVQAVSSLPKLYIIPSGQIEHELTQNIPLTPIAPRLAEKNPIWGDDICLSGNIDKVYYQVLEEPVSLPLEKTLMLKELHSNVEWKISPNKKILPRFSDMFYSKLPSEIVSASREQVINLNNNIQLSYYIQGPVSGRSLPTSDLQLQIENVPVELKLRFWVDKNGKVNQVVLEEKSGFPIIDKKVVNTIKHWRFRPVYTPLTPKYEWGIMKIRIQ